MKWTRTNSVRIFVSGWVVSIFAVVFANIAVEAFPHTRGLGFFSDLRYALITPLCFLSAILSAFLYEILVSRYERAKRIFATILFIFAGMILLLLSLIGPPGLALASGFAVMIVTIFMAFLIPKFAERKEIPLSFLRIVGIVLLSLIEVVAWFGAVSSERMNQQNVQAVGFEIPRGMFDVDHKYIDLPSGARIHYVDEGKGETILFLHGNPAWSFQWRDLILGLRNSYRCVTLDYPGFGFSEGSAGFGFTPREQSLVVEEFINQLELRNITLVMQDWGGPIGLGFAGRHPELVRQVVLGSTWAWQTPTGTPRGRFSQIAGGPIGEFVQMNFNGFARLGITNGIVRKLPPEVLDTYVRPFRPLSRRGIAAFYPGQITSATEYFAEVENGLSKLTDKQALIFWALQDAGFPHEDLIRFQKTFSKNKTIEFPDANHFFFEDTAEEMISEIREFMEGGK
ncbi:alpha/beta fold hydrolase [Leptospira ilyithenensis]|nr:alpha/beta fold hydrolase [Leptospira ilyithenensis]